MVELVGILNITPDSFSDGGQFFAPENALQQAAKLFDDGASMIDIGAESTRPGALQLTASEEWQRLEPVLRVLIPAHPEKISLDSYHPETIERAFNIGPVIINDVTGMNNPLMITTAAKLKARVIISHLAGADVQAAHQGAHLTTIEEVKHDLLARVRLLQNTGIHRDRIILDPGIGFGKTMELNTQLLRFAEHVPEFKVMIGYSRKRFLGENRMELAPNLAAGRVAVASGAAYLRVHDVAGHRQSLGQS